MVTRSLNIDSLSIHLGYLPGASHCVRDTEYSNEWIIQPLSPSTTKHTIHGVYNVEGRFMCKETKKTSMMGIHARYRKEIWMSSQRWGSLSSDLKGKQFMRGRDRGRYQAEVTCTEWERVTCLRVWDGRVGDETVQGDQTVKSPAKPRGVSFFFREHWSFLSRGVIWWYLFSQKYFGQSV